jgi:hypothetical protein
MGSDVSVLPSPSSRTCVSPEVNTNRPPRGVATEFCVTAFDIRKSPWCRFQVEVPSGWEPRLIEKLPPVTITSP